MSAPYFDLRLGRVVQAGQPQVEARAEAPMQPMGQTEGGSGGKVLLLVALAGAIGYGVWYFYKKSEEEESIERGDEEGYWVKVYDRPRGDPERELQSTKGPFTTREKAEQAAKDFESDAYPVVAWSNEDPLDAER